MLTGKITSFFIILVSVLLILTLLFGKPENVSSSSSSK